MTDELKDRHYSIAVVDGDILAYRSACVGEQTVYHLYDENGDMVKEFESAASCKSFLEDLEMMLGVDVSGYERVSVKVDRGSDYAEKALQSLIKNVQRNVSADEYIFYLTGKNNFREDVATIAKYKGNRDDVARPKYLNHIRDYMTQNYSARTIEGKEADDAIGVAVHTGFKRNGYGSRIVHVGADKDIRNVAGVHFSIMDETFAYVDAYDANHWLFVQALAGDATDNIKGLKDISLDFRTKYGLTKRKGVGYKTAEAILEGCETFSEMYLRCLEAYQTYYGDTVVYISHDGNKIVRTPEEMLDENLALVFIEREKGLDWYGYKEKHLVY